MARNAIALRIPERVSLVAQAEQIILEGMQSGHWQRFLPGERRLCRELQVSRWTLRTALANLAHRKHIRIKQGLPCAITAAARGPRSRKHAWRLGYLLPDSLLKLRPFVALMVDELREYVQQIGGRLEIYTRPKFYLTRHSRALEDFVEQNPHDLWVLANSTRPMQLWFQRQALPVIIGGSLHPGVRLPSINLDYFGVGRHAAGAVLARGHRQSAVLVSNRGVPAPHVGAMELVRGYQAGTAASRSPVRDPIIVFHDGEKSAMCRILDRLLALPQPPTALLVMDSAAFLAVFTHLSRLQVAIPRQMSVIVAEDEPYYTQIVPEVTHYEWDLGTFVKQWSSLLRQTVNSTLNPDTRVRIVPRFIEGEMLAYREPMDTKVP